jgi:hypothetical protein
MAFAIAGVRPDDGALTRLSSALAVELDQHVAVNALREHVDRATDTFAHGGSADALLAQLEVQNAIVEAAFLKYQACQQHAGESARHVCREECNGQMYFLVADAVASHTPEELAQLCREELRRLVVSDASMRDTELRQVPAGMITHALLRACQRLSGM